MDVKFKQWNCSLAFGEYKNGRTMLFLTEKETLEDVLCASVNLPDWGLRPNEIAIKDYSENEGVLDVLIEHKVVSKPKRYVNLTHVSVPICELLIQETI
tara:strand:- start:794 stop:1090 length:297 start_codon:yes stop_codon:yes gene_type:complete